MFVKSIQTTISDPLPSNRCSPFRQHLLKRTSIYRDTNLFIQGLNHIDLQLIQYTLSNI